VPSTKSSPNNRTRSLFPSPGTPGEGRVRAALFLLIPLLSTTALAKDPNIKDFGALGDGKTLDSASIQKAIDTATTSGGGKVLIPRGDYLVGTILLKNNVTLHLEEGASLLGTTDLKQYQNVDPFKEGLGAEVGWAMVAAIDATNIAIEGKGTINGRGKDIAAVKGFKGEGWGFRPMLLRLVRCSDVTLKDVTFRDAAAWTTNYFRCKNVKIDGIKIDSHVAPHNDGINIDSSEGFTITNCDVDSGDDALVLKSTSDKPCRNITATGCKLKSRQGAIKLGTESFGGFENIRISDCTIYDTRNGGIKVLCVDGGTLQDIVISDITMDNVRTPIFVRLGARLKTFRDGQDKKSASILRNVTIKNVKAKAATEAQLKPPSGIFITGIEGARIENLALENIQIHLAGGGTAEHVRAKVEEKPDTYPEINRFGPTLPAYGAFIRHAKGVTLKDVTFTTDSPDLRPAVVCQDVHGLTCEALTIPGNPQSESLVRLESTTDAAFKNVKLNGDAQTFLRIEGESSNNIAKPHLDQGTARRLVDVSAGAPESAVK
jgi:polygalacturonase